MTRSSFLKSLLVAPIIGPVMKCFGAKAGAIKPIEWVTVSGHQAPEFANQLWIQSGTSRGGALFFYDGKELVKCETTCTPWFLQGLQDIESGRVVDMERALTEPPYFAAKRHEP
jgi:hypothetical protein